MPDEFGRLTPAELDLYRRQQVLKRKSLSPETLRSTFKSLGNIIPEPAFVGWEAPDTTTKITYPPYEEPIYEHNVPIGVQQPEQPAQPEEPEQPWWQTGLEYALYPFTAAGMATKQLVEEPTQYRPWAGAQTAYELATATPEQRQRAFQEFPEVLPGGKQFEEYKGIPLWQQLAYEAPAYVAASAGLPGALAGWKAAGQLSKPAMLAARTALAPFAGAEYAGGQALKYGITIPATKGIPAAGRRLLQAFLDTGLDSWIARLGRGYPQASGGIIPPSTKEASARIAINISSWIKGNKSWLIERATQNMLRRQAGQTGAKAAETAAKAAADDTIKEATPLLLKSAGIEVNTPEKLVGVALNTKVTPRLPELPVGITRVPEAIAELAKSPSIAGPAGTNLPGGVTYLPQAGALATNTQKVSAHNIAKAKGLISEAGKMKPQYRRLAKAITGKKSMTQMTQEEADMFTEALKGLVGRPGKPPKIPVSTNIITQEFAEKIPMLQEIGFLEKVRPTRQVFEKIGLRSEVWEPAFESEVKLYEDKVAFRKELEPKAKFVGRHSDRDSRLFDAMENPKLMVALPSEERAVAEWGRKFFNEWADKLKLPQEKRRENYITHLFEEQITQDLAAKHPIDPELVKAMDFITPKTIFNPYLQERLGQTLGLKRSFLDSINAYESRALRTFHYEPLIQRIRVYEKYLPPNSAKYLKDFITRITNRPLAIDREVSQTLKEFGKAVEKLPGGKQLSEQLGKGNMAGLIAYNYASLLYFRWLGFKPTSSIRNLGQHMLTLAEVGPINLAKGIGYRFTDEGKAVLKESMVLRSRSQALMPGIDSSFATRWTDKIRETSLKMFRLADKQNVSDAFLAGYAEAKSLELPRSWAIKRGDEVAADTQYLYTKLNGAAWSQSALGRVLSPLTTWPENWVELIAKWSKGKKSYVYRDYEKDTGKKVTQMAWNTRRKAIMLYLALVGAAYTIENTTDFRASEYTGWTSISYLVNVAKGEFPALSDIGAIASVIGGILTSDERLTKSGWNKISPEQWMGIVNQFKRIADGKTDWLSLFVYTNPEQDTAEPKEPTPPAEQAQKDIRTEYQDTTKQIEEDIWAKYPAQYREIAEQIKELEKTDPAAAKRLQLQYPWLIDVRRQIAQQQIAAKRQRAQQEALQRREALIGGR